MNVIERINMLKKIVKEAEKLVTWQENIYTALHNIHADWIVSGVLALARIPHHHTTHEPGGVDEVSGVVPGAHAASHQNGGTDEIDVAGLSGELADNQPPKAHKDSHDPEDGSDPLDTAIPVKVGAANAEGSSHSLARADHLHEREHAKYTNAEAVSAMGAKADDNPLHHDRPGDGDLAPKAHVSTHEPGGADPMRWGANKLLKGAGPGADPTEIDVPSGLTFTELAGQQNKKVSTASTWEDWDLTAIVGSGAVAVLVAMVNYSTTAQRSGGARKNGSVLDRKVALGVTTLPASCWHITLLAECDVNRVIEIYGGSITEVHFQVLGYWS